MRRRRRRRERTKRRRKRGRRLRQRRTRRKRRRTRKNRLLKTAVRTRWRRRAQRRRPKLPEPRADPRIWRSIKVTLLDDTTYELELDVRTLLMSNFKITEYIDRSLS